MRKFLLLVGCLPWVTTMAQSIYDIVTAADDLTTLAAVLRLTPNFVTIFNSSVVTLFAPVDRAFANFDPRFLEPEWNLHLQTIIGFHGVRGVFNSSELIDGRTLNLGSPDAINITVNENGTFLETGRQEPVQVVDVDDVAVNGVLHRIDAVLLPSLLSTSLLQVANRFSFFSVVTELVARAGMEDELSSAPAVTFFAPANVAFDNATTTLVESLSLEELQTLLRLHVARGVFPSNLLEDGMELLALSNDTLVISRESDAVSVEGIPISIANTLGSNGIAHIIESVIPLPVNAPDDDTTREDDDENDDTRDPNEPNIDPFLDKMFKVMSSLTKLVAP